MHNHKNQILIGVLAFAYVSFYNIFNLKSLYYNTALQGFSLSHLQLGQIYSACGLTAMGAYLCGAIFLNHFSSRRLIIGSSLLMGGLTFALSSSPSYAVLLLLFALVGLIVNATFYPAYMDIINHIAINSDNQGKVYSRFYIYNSAIGCLVAFLGYRCIGLAQNPSEQLRMLLLFFVGLNILTALSAQFIMKNIPGIEKQSHALQKKDILAVLENKKLWLVIFIIFANYINYSNLNYTLPYLSANMTLPKQVVDIISIARVYIVIMAAAPAACILTNRLHSAVKLMKYSFLAYCAATLSMMLLFRGSYIMTILCILAMCFFTTMGKSMSFITIQEAGLHPAQSGIAFSLLAFAGFSPDAFYYSLSGFLLDTFPNTGYLIIFLFSALVALSGAWATTILNQKNR